MNTIDMLWDDLEKIVADSVYEQLSSLSHNEKVIACQNLRRNERYRLKCYRSPNGGETYALWFHMMRADNICIALDELHRIHPLFSTMRILDIGSGTGAAVMAVACWVEYTFALVPRKLRFSCIEPAEPMRRTAKHILNMLQSRYYAEDATLSNRVLNWSHSSKVPDINRC